MMRSMFAGVSGLRNHQTRMDVIGNNIANVNTVGYKRSRVTFQDMLSQTVRGASSPQNGKGGTNPQQIGLGVTVNSIDTIQTQGSSETTGKVTDMMVDGDGFFIVGNGTNNYYTRAGNFDFDSVGNLLNPNGMLVQGWAANNAGLIDTSQPTSGISIPKGQSIQPKVTTEASLVGNLDSAATQYVAGPPTSGTTVPVTVTAYDSLGNSWPLVINFDKLAGANAWTTRIADPGWAAGGGAAPAIGAPAVTFDGLGQMTAPAAKTLTITGTPPQGAAAMTITVDISGLNQFSDTSNVQMNSQDGYATGVLNGYSIDKAGIITGRFSNGLTKQMAQVAIANFNNASGLTKAGENLYIQSNNSGNAQVGVAGAGGRGDVSPGKLEMSNVDLSQEFTDMIITQRGFQANSRIITTSDEMLQELVNLKR